MKKALLLFVFIHVSLLTIQCFAQIPTMPGKWQWVKSIGSNYQQSGSGYKDERINMMKVDKQGNTYVGGEIMGNPYVQGLNGGNQYAQINNPHQSFSVLQGFLAKYDCDGNLKWFKTLGDSLYESVINDITIDSAGNIYAIAETGYGYNRTYWGDSVIYPLYNQNGIITYNSIVMKINPTNGALTWTWTPFQFWGTNASYWFGSPNGGGRYTSKTANFMACNRDTLTIFVGGDSVFVPTQTSQRIYLYDFNINTGQLIKKTELCIVDGNSSYVGFGTDNNGNLYTAVNFQSQYHTFLGQVLNAHWAVNKGTIIKFNRTHVIQTMFLDSAAIVTSNLSNPDLGIELVCEGNYGAKLTGSYILKTNTIFGTSADAVALAHFDNNLIFKWATEADTSTYGTGFVCLAKDNANKIYSDMQFNTYAKIQNSVFANSNNVSSDIVFKFDLNDSLIDKMFPIVNTISPTTNPFFIAFNLININEKGELIGTGNFNDNIISSTDTSIFQGGHNDLFVIKFGYPCNSDSALIAPVATNNLKAVCTNADSIQLTWNDNSNIEWGYHIYRSNSRNGSYALIATTNPNINSYFDNTISNNSNYWYKVAAFNNIGNGAFTNIDSSMCAPEGINPLTNKNSQLEVYPNPCENKLTVSGIQFSVNSKIEIENVLGQMMMVRQTHHDASNNLHTDNRQLNTKDLPSGIYFIKAEDEKGFVHTAKFVKE